MKKSELTQLTQIIEVLVTREIKKQLPKLIGEVFQNMAGKSMIAEHVKPVRNDCVGKEVEPSVVPKDPHEFRASLKELFSGVTPVTRTELEDGIQLPPPRAIIQYAKDPVLNKILNETTSDLTAKDRFTGMAAFQGGYNPGMPSVAAMAGIGEMMAESEMPAFARGQAPISSTSAPVSIRKNHVPMSAIPEGISALDVARAGMTTPAITEALTNYDRMKKILESSKGRR